ncbi:MAG TPA: hypothetical protein VNK70_01090 [Candidatus Paceibacterota bacterium]|nr:hypothetical protein [Candidatus Paceibacterota bacterium]
MQTRKAPLVIFRQPYIGLILLALIFAPHFYNKYPIFKNIVEQFLLSYANHITSNYSYPNEFFIGVAAAILGTIAIAFSLATLSIQYAAEKGTTTVLNEYKNDPVYLGSFSAIGVFAVIIFIFSLLPNNPTLILLGYVIAFFFLAATLILLLQIIRHTIDLVNPINRIDTSYEKIKAYLSSLSSNLENAIDSGVITRGDNDATR